MVKSACRPGYWHDTTQSRVLSVYNLPGFSDSFVHLPLFPDFASAMSLEMSLAASHFVICFTSLVRGLFS